MLDPQKICLDHLSASPQLCPIVSDPCCLSLDGILKETICEYLEFILESYFRFLTICLLLVYFVSAAGCHCFDLRMFIQTSEKGHG